MKYSIFYVFNRFILSNPSGPGKTSEKKSMHVFLLNILWFFWAFFYFIFLWFFLFASKLFLMNYAHRKVIFIYCILNFFPLVVRVERIKFFLLELREFLTFLDRKVDEIMKFQQFFNNFWIWIHLIVLKPSKIHFY